MYNCVYFTDDALETGSICIQTYVVYFALLISVCIVLVAITVSIKDQRMLGNKCVPVLFFSQAVPILFGIQFERVSFISYSDKQRNLFRIVDNINI